MDRELEDAIVAIQDEFVHALDDGTAKYKLPDPSYKWRCYPEPTPRYFRATIEVLDDFVGASPQQKWAQMHHYNALGIALNAKPDLGRLTDAQLEAFFQRLDTAYGNYFDSQPEIPTVEDTRAEETTE